MLPVVVKNFSNEEQLLQYVTHYRRECKVAPAYVLYLCALHLSKKSKSSLKLFLSKAVEMIDNMMRKAKYDTEYAFWLANASELLHFLKYDKTLWEYSVAAQEYLTITIQSILHGLLTYFVSCIKNGASDTNSLDATMCVLNGVTATFEEFHVNVAFINQFLSFLLQWICGKLIANTEDPPAYYDYFKELKQWALTMDDECLLNKVIEFANLMKDNTIQDVEGSNLVNLIKLKWHPPKFLEDYRNKGTYNTFIERAAKLLSEINGGETYAHDEAIEFQLLIPYTGYSCHNIRHIPDWLDKLFQPIHVNGWCTLQDNQRSSRGWNVYLKGQKVERVSLANVQFEIRPDSKMLRNGVGHVTGLSSPMHTLAIGDQIISINGKRLNEIAQKEAEVLTRRLSGRDKLEVVKIDTCKILLQTLTSADKAEEATEATIKFNLVESSYPNPREDLSQSIPSEYANIFQKIISEVKGLDNMLGKFDGSSEDDRNYIYMKEVMMRNIIKLDNMDTGNSKEVMETRKNVIYSIQDKIEELKAKLVANREKYQNDGDVTADAKEDSRENPTEVVAMETETTPPAEESQNCGSQPVGPVADTEDVFEKLEIPGPFRLIHESKYNLNLSDTKFVCTGIYPSKKRNVPAVKFSAGSFYILLGMDDWKALLSFEHRLREHFQNKIRHPIQQTIGSYELNFATDCVGIRSKIDFVYLDQECVQNLLQLSHLITSGLDLVEGYCNQLHRILTSMADSQTDPVEKLEQQKNNFTPEMSHVIGEYIYFYPDVIRKHVEMIRKRQNTEPEGGNWV